MFFVYVCYQVCVYYIYYIINICYILTISLPDIGVNGMECNPKPLDDQTPLTAEHETVSFTLFPECGVPTQSDISRKIIKAKKKRHTVPDPDDSENIAMKLSN